MQNIAIITGASGGIGTAICNKLNKNGYKIIGIVKELDSKFEFAQEVCDLSQINNIESIFKEILNKYETPSVLVNNAGIYLAKNWQEISLEEFVITYNINLISNFIISKLIIQKMIDENIKGSIINISSVSAYTGSIDPSYASSKAAVSSLTKSLAKEVAKYGITINSIAPGVIETEMLNSIPEDRKLKYKNTIPMQRLGTPDEIASIVAFLVGEDAKYITGTEIHANGGLY